MSGQPKMFWASGQMTGMKDEHKKPRIVQIVCLRRLPNAPGPLGLAQTTPC